MNTQTRSIALSLAAALGFTLLALPAAQADTDVPAPELQTRSTLTRAEVQADLALWRRAGLLALNNHENSDIDRPGVAERLALYKQWRSGAEYRAELARQRGAATTTAQAESAPSAR